MAFRIREGKSGVMAEHAKTEFLDKQRVSYAVEN